MHMLSFLMLLHHGPLFPTRGRFQCLLSQFYIGLWALWDNYIWEKQTYNIHSLYLEYDLIFEFCQLLFFVFLLFFFSVKVCMEEFFFLSQSFHVLFQSENTCW